MPFLWRNPETGSELWLDTANFTVSLEYDLRNRGIIIGLTPNTAGSASAVHWWFDLETQSFWKMKFGSYNQEPFCLHARRNFIAASATDSRSNAHPAEPLPVV